MKYAVILALTLLVAGCSTPQQSLDEARDECAFIGYDITRERVATLDCTKEGYRSRRAQQGTAVNTVRAVAVGVATVGLAGAVQ